MIAYTKFELLHAALILHLCLIPVVLLVMVPFFEEWAALGTVGSVLGHANSNIDVCLRAFVAIRGGITGASGGAM